MASGAFSSIHPFASPLVPSADPSSACSRPDSLAPRAAALGFHTTTFLDRDGKQGAGRVGGEASSVRTQKRTRDSLEGKTTRGRGVFAAGEASIVVPAPGQQRLQERMKAELEAVRDLHRKAVLLCRSGGAAPAAKGVARSSATGPRREAPSEAAAKRRRTSPMTKPATEAAHRIRPVKQQQPPSQRAAAAPPLPERKIEKAKDVEERRRRMEEEIARATEEFRRQVLAMTALPDETVYRHELEELGIAPFEYAVTQTRSQTQSQDRILLGVAYW